MNLHSPDQWGKISIDLASEPDFALGSLAVRPSLRRIERVPGETVELEPRVMQVLVALRAADGAVLSRDQLIRLCWGGRVVGDDALNRCIVALRRISRQFADPAFRIDCVPRVGYRLATSAAEAEAPARPAAEEQPARSMDRRRLIGAGLTAGLAATAGGSWWWMHRQREVPPEAVALYERARATRGSASPEQADQALHYLREATRIAPEYAAAWGFLSLAYLSAMRSDPGPQRSVFRNRALTAADRALSLDPDDVDARLALIMVQPIFRNWAAIEAQCRKLLREAPTNDTLLHQMTTILSDVGRFSDAILFARAANAASPLMPVSHYLLAVSLWSAGRIDEAERALDEASVLWPKHGAIWTTKLRFLAFTGRGAAASALIEDPSARPLDFPESEVDRVRTTLRAAATRDSHDIDRALAGELAIIPEIPHNAPVAAQYCAAFGRLDEAFALLEGYYLGIGPWAAAYPGPALAQYLGTRVLFQALTAPLRRDRRFSNLTRRTGLEDYWRATGTRPDYLA